MKLQLKFILIISPLVILSTIIFGSWSISKSNETSWEFLSTYMSFTLDAYIRNHPERLEELLSNYNLQDITSYEESYQQEAIAAVSEMNLLWDGHLFIFDSSGAQIFCSLGHDPESFERGWKAIVAEAVMELGAEPENDFVPESQINDKQIYQYRYFEAWDWFIFLGIPLKVIYDAQDRVRNITLLIALGAGGVSILLIIFIVRYLILKSVFKLTKAAKLVASGVYPKQIDVNSKDELEVLAKSMEDMSTSLGLHIERQHNWNKELESEIDLKTRELQKSLAEKEILMREIYHRVKNNLSIILSLLQFQLGMTEDESFSLVLRQIQNRIFAMSLIHQMLYTADDLTHIRFDDYCRELVDHLFDSFNIDQGRISLHLDIDDVALDIDTVKTCGLIINELVINSLKYAFPENRKGAIRIIYKCTTKNKYVLEVSDNGVGMRKADTLVTEKSMGMFLVSALTEELEGELSIDTENGVTTSIRFPQ
jgi:two-component sensor histidine kinase